MKGPRDCHSEQRKSTREGQILYDIPYMWNPEKLYKGIYLQNRNRVTDIRNNFMVAWKKRGER